MKRILIVGAKCLNQPNASGITLRSILGGIDPSDVLGIAWGEYNGYTQTQAIKVETVQYRSMSAGRLLDNTYLKRISQTVKKVEERPSGKGKQQKRTSILKHGIQNVRQWIALLPAHSRVKISEKNWAAIRTFNPQVIYTVGESVTTLRTAYDLSMKLNIPIVIHFMDNWKHSIEWASNPLLRRYQRNLTQWCNRCYSRSNGCIAIGEQMAAVYEKETGIRHSVVMNSVDTRSYLCLPRKNDGVVRFVYAGGLHLGRNNILLAIGEIIDRICEEGGRRVQFSIYTGSENIELFAEQFTHLKHTNLYPAVPHEEIKQVYMESDVLVHVESDSVEDNEFFKYSVSTKIPEYLATGLTILFWGSKELYLYNWLKENALAYTVSNADEGKKLIQKLIQGLENPFSENAKSYAASHFDISVARERFYQTVENAHLP